MVASPLRRDPDHTMTSIFSAIGGAPAVALAVDDFYARALADDLLSGYFDGVDLTKQKRHMRAFLAGAIGGPDVYAGRDMGAAHAHLNITDAAFDRVVEHLVATLTALAVPAPSIEAIGAKIAPLRAQIVAPAGAAPAASQLAASRR
jgi:hemoglobin